jgi:hypothetical protein
VESRVAGHSLHLVQVAVAAKAAQHEVSESGRSIRQSSEFSNCSRFSGKFVNQPRCDRQQYSAIGLAVSELSEPARKIGPCMGRGKRYICAIALRNARG